jgi:hypothetical protein
MSAPLAGKFQDHYKVLGIDAKSGLETIQQAYGKLAQKYNPRNDQNGDQEKFDAVNLALRSTVRCGTAGRIRQAEERRRRQGRVQIQRIGLFRALGHETALRAALLCLLYDSRRKKPFTPGLSMRIVENMLETHG